jgi:hypothetical protein
MNEHSSTLKKPWQHLSKRALGAFRLYVMLALMPYHASAMTVQEPQPVPIPSPKRVNLQGLQEVYRVVVYHNDNAKPTGSPR